MKDMQKTIAYVAGATILAKVANLLLGVLLMELLGKRIYFEQVRRHLEASSLPPPQALVDFQVQWPWYYVSILVGVFSIYWFFVGKVAQSKLGQPLWRYILLSSPLYFLLTFDWVFPLYAALTLAGGISSYSKKQ